MLNTLKLMLVGCGAMGSAMIRGWVGRDVGGKRYTVVTPLQSDVTPLRSLAEIDWYEKPEDVPSSYQPDVVVLAVKPQMMDDVLPAYRKYVSQHALFVTVAAGKPLGYYTPYMGHDLKLVRIMPNLPAAYNKGMTFGVASGTCQPDDLHIAHELFSALGKMLWLKDESLFDVAAAVSGCGPAYLYLLTDALANAGIEAGLDPEASALLARQAMVGAGAHLEHAEEPAHVLKKRVTSPGGMTEAALRVLEAENGGIPSLMTDAIIAATQRAKELAHG
jgi:pyrroline-5-carboxylate reductase